jgi:cell wall-associated NlpC family hydrolase
MSSKKSSKNNVLAKVANAAAKVVAKATGKKTQAKNSTQKTASKATQKTAQKKSSQSATPKKTTQQKVDQVFGNAGNIIGEKTLANRKITNNAMNYIKNAAPSKAGNVSGNVFGNVLQPNGNVGAKVGSTFARNNPSKGSTILKSAEKYLGTPYVWGGKRKEQGGIDCSGFVYRALEDSGYKLPETIGYTDANDLRFGGEVVDKSKLKPGDIVFYSDNKHGYATHVAIYVGNGKIIHSAGGSKNTRYNPGKGVSYQNLDYRNDYLEARRYK